MGFLYNFFFSRNVLIKIYYYNLFIQYNNYLSKGLFFNELLVKEFVTIFRAVLEIQIPKVKWQSFSEIEGKPGGSGRTRPEVEQVGYL